MRSFGCRRLTIVRGDNAAAIEVDGAAYFDNVVYASTSEAYTLSLASEVLQPATLVSFGDLVLKRDIIHSLLEDAGDGIVAVVDSKLAGAEAPDRVRCDRRYTGRFELDSVHLQQIGPDVSPASSDGVWIGLLHVGRDGARWMVEAIDEARAAGTLRTDRI